MINVAITVTPSEAARAATKGNKIPLPLARLIKIKKKPKPSPATIGKFKSRQLIFESSARETNHTPIIATMKPIN